MVKMDEIKRRRPHPASRCQRYLKHGKRFIQSLVEFWSGWGGRVSTSKIITPIFRQELLFASTIFVYRFGGVGYSLVYGFISKGQCYER